MAATKLITLGFADDHTLLRKALVRMLLTYGNYKSLFDVDTGTEVIEQLRNHKIPDVLILDVNMAGKDGIETTKWVHAQFPQVKILGLSMYNDEETIMRMIHAGASGYITKNSDTEKLRLAIDTVYETGIFLPDSLSLKLFAGIQSQVMFNTAPVVVLTEREKQFLALLTRDLSYKEIANKMFISVRTVEDYRNKLAKKLTLKGKSGLIAYAIKNGYK